MKYINKYIELSGEGVKKKKQNEEILVNINRLYEMMSLAMRSIENDADRKRVIGVQYKALSKVKNEDKMFVQMSVEDAKTSFGGKIENMPPNTFKEVNTNAEGIILEERVKEGREIILE